MDSPLAQNVAPGGGNKPDRPDSPHHVWVFVAIVILLVLAGGAAWLYFGGSAPAPSSNRPIDLRVSDQDVRDMADIAAVTDGKDVPPAMESITLPPFNKYDHVYGDQAAPYSIVEYANFGNKYADLLHPYIKTLVDGSNGDVNWVVRHFPLSEEDYVSAQAAECAYFEKGHDGFWLYFWNAFGKPPRTVDDAVAAADLLGLDGDAMRNCLVKNHTRDIVLGSSKDGQLDAKVNVSPSYVVSNNFTNDVRLVEGVNTIDYIRKVLDAVQ